MGMFDDTHAWSVTLSVVFVALSIGMLSFAALAPGTRILAFLITIGVSLIAAVAIHGYGIYRYETERIAEHKKLAKVQPEQCPDYWTGRYDACSNSMVCEPYFQTADPHAPKVFMHRQMSPVNVQQHAAKGADRVCADDLTREYPWMEVTNSCDARGRSL